VIGRRVRVGNEDRGRACCRKLPHRPARAGDRDVGGGKDVPEAVRVRHQHVAAAMHPRRQAGVVSLPRDVQHAGAAVAPGSHRHLVERGRAREGAEDGDDRLVRPEAEVLPRLRPVRTDMRQRDRPADDLHLAAAAAGNLVGEEELLRKRGGEPVREAEVRVGLGESGGNATQPRREHHRAGHVTAAAEDDVWPAPHEDRAAGERSLRSAPERPEQRNRRRAREAADLERVELEARFRNQPRLDAVGTAGERHARSARAQRFPDCERGPDVTGCSSRRDHDYELRRLDHSRRC